jgi:hypothetical protein
MTPAVIVVADQRNLESQVVERRAANVVPVKASAGVGVPPVIDQHQELRMPVAPERRVVGRDGQETDGRCFRFVDGPVSRDWRWAFFIDRHLARLCGGRRVVGRFGERTESEHITVEFPHSRQIANAEDDLSHGGDGWWIVHR